MARVTVEDCLKKVDNRFALVHMAAKRVRQLRKGAEPQVTSKNRDYVIALREIAAGKVVAGKSQGQVSSIGQVLGNKPQVYAQAVEEQEVKKQMEPPVDKADEGEVGGITQQDSRMNA